MNRKQFMASLLTLPVINYASLVEKKQRWEPPKHVVACIGESSRIIFQHIEHYRTSSNLDPYFVEAPETFNLLLYPIERSAVHIISRLDEPLFPEILKVMDSAGPDGRMWVNGMFTHPFNQESSLMVDNNLKKALSLCFNILLFAWNDYQEPLSEAIHPMKWLNDKMDRSERLIIWEILVRYDWSGRLIRTKQYGKRTFYDKYLSHTNR
ncbi:MAG: hypothetical protein ABSC53_11820 [Bacteroidota bacterium]